MRCTLSYMVTVRYALKHSTFIQTQEESNPCKQVKCQFTVHFHQLNNVLRKLDQTILWLTIFLTWQIQTFIPVVLRTCRCNYKVIVLQAFLALTRKLHMDLTYIIYFCYHKVRLTVTIIMHDFRNKSRIFSFDIQ